jgi:hypothetical protein
MKPTTGIAACCARAASGHAPANPPTSLMKSRRLMRLPNPMTTAYHIIKMGAVVHYSKTAPVMSVRGQPPS